MVNVLQTLSTPSSPQLDAPARSEVGARPRSSTDGANSATQSGSSFDTLVNNATDDTRDANASGLEPNGSNPGANPGAADAAPLSDGASSLNSSEHTIANAHTNPASTNPLITLAAALESYVDATHPTASSTSPTATAGSSAGPEAGAGTGAIPTLARAEATPSIGASAAASNAPEPATPSTAGAAAPAATTPTISAPAISAPVVSAPAISAPIISAPVVSAPVVSAPVVSTPVASSPPPPAAAPIHPATTEVAAPVVATPINANTTIDSWANAGTGAGVDPRATAGTAEASAIVADAARALKASGDPTKSSVNAASFKSLSGKTAETDAPATRPGTPPTARIAEPTPGVASGAHASLTQTLGTAASSPNSAARAIAPAPSATGTTTSSAPAKAASTPNNATAKAATAPNAASSALPEPFLEAVDTARMESQIDSAKVASDNSRLDAANAMRAPERTAGSIRAQAPDLAAFAIRFAKQAANGARRFEIRLDPAELGRVDVRVEVNDDGVAQARLLVERPEALAELMRHARSLERELSEAGIDLADDGLKFELAEDAHGDGGQTGDAPHDESAPPPHASSVRAVAARARGAR